MALLIFIGLLVALILVHELGHFFVAKFFKIRVDEFGIFFPPRLLAKKFGETEYSLNALPFGGYVKIFGENAEEAKNPRSFASKPRLVQAAVIVAGVLMNIVFAWIIVSLGYVVGLPTAASHQGFGEVSNPKTMIVAILPSSPAEKSGVETKDIVIGIATGVSALEEPLSAERAQAFIKEHQDESIVLSTLRGEEEKTFVIRPEEGLTPGRKVLGIQMDDVGVLNLPLHLALLEGGVLTYRMTIATAEGLSSFFSNLVRGAANFGDVAGPIGIAGIGANAVEEGFTAAILLIAIISVNLAIINLIPIPGLDGGRLLIIAVEAVIRRPVSPKLTLVLTILGFMFLIGLMLLVSYHDILRLIG